MFPVIHFSGSHANQGLALGTKPSFESRLKIWADTAPQEKDRATAVKRMKHAHTHRLSELDLSDLAFSSFPFEPDDMPTVRGLNIGTNKVEALSTEWMDTIAGLEHLGSQIQSLDNQSQWADLLANGTLDRHKQAAIQHNLELGQRLAQSGPQINETAGCKDAIRRMSLALSLAIELNYEVPAVARHLLSVAPPELQFFEVQRTLIARSEIESVASGRQLPAQERQNLERIYSDIKQGWATYIYQSGLLSAGAVAWGRLQATNQVPPPTLDETVTHISAQLVADTQAMEGLKYALKQNKPVNEGGLQINIEDALRHVWAYCVRHDTLRDSLIEAFAIRLRDIARERCCNTGCVQRLLQTPEGIDEAFNIGLPDEKALREEFGGLIPRIIAHLDEQIEQDKPAWTEAESQKASTSQAEPHPERERRAFERQLQWKGQAVLSSIQRTFTDLRGLPKSMVDANMMKPLEDLEKNELYLTDRTLGDLSIDYRDVFGRSALYIAVSQGDLDSVHKQLKAGAAVDFFDSLGRTPLHTASNNGDAKIASALLTAGANVDKADNRGWQALHFAAHKGHTEIAKRLLQAGAAHGTQDQSGLQPIHLAVQNDHAEIVKALLDNGADIETVRWQAAKRGNAAVLAVLHDRADWKSHDFATLLHVAAQFGNTEALKMWLRGGVEIETADDTGLSALHIAAKNGHTETVKALLEAGADAGKAAKIGWTALHLAAQSGHTETVKALLSVSGIDIKFKTPTGDSARRLARLNGHQDIVKLLSNLPAYDNTLRSAVKKIFGVFK